jgi:hypothetical protein
MKLQAIKTSVQKKTEQDEENEDNANVIEDEAMNTHTFSYPQNRRLGDSGLSCHMKHEKRDLFDIERINGSVKVSGGRVLHALFMERKRSQVAQLGETKHEIIVNDIK